MHGSADQRRAGDVKPARILPDEEKRPVESVQVLHLPEGLPAAAHGEGEPRLSIRAPRPLAVISSTMPRESAARPAELGQAEPRPAHRVASSAQSPAFRAPWSSPGSTTPAS
ncbi:MAG TPA: hypothetical protein VKV40_17075 [Ktedonobacteraceae bacterium]|nr:hypothetical protein [Ktedonobacteraceae bacterium]